MRQLLMLLLAFPLLVSAQKQNPDRLSDSVQAMDLHFQELQKRFRDSLLHSDEFKQLQSVYCSTKTQTDDYNSFMLGAEIVSADYGSFNTSIAAKGLTPLPNQAYRLAIGFSFKRKRWVHDLSLFLMGFNHKTANNTDEIKIATNALSQWSVGYDFVKSQGINLYPYAGIALRSTVLKYKTTSVYNSNASDVSDWVVNNRNVTATAMNLGYQAGICIEAVIAKGKKACQNGTIFYLRGGTSGIFGDTKFKHDGMKLTTDIKYGNVTFAAGFKFFSR